MFERSKSPSSWPPAGRPDNRWRTKRSEGIDKIPFQFD